MSVVGVILGLAVIIGMFVIASVIAYVSTRTAPLSQKLVLVAISVSAVIGVLCTLYFLASFTPMLVSGCSSGADCQVPHAVQELVSIRWKAFVGAIGMFTVSLAIMKLFGVRRSSSGGTSTSGT